MSRHIPTDILSVNQCSSDMNLPKNIQAWLTRLKTQTSKNRSLLDCDTEALIKTFKKNVELNIICTDASVCYERTPLNLNQQYCYYKEMARSSGALNFLCAQYNGAISIIANSNNETLKEKWLYNNLNGEYLFGISHAHLRNVTTPPVVAIENGTHYIVNGTLPYVTGYKIFNMLLLGFVSDNKEIFALTPFYQSESFAILKQLNLVATNSANTVICQLFNHIIDKSMVVSENPLGLSLSTSNQRGGSIIASNLGLAIAAMDLISDHKLLEIEIVKNTYNFLIQEILNCEHKLFKIPPNTSIVPLRTLSTIILNKIFLFCDQVLKGATTVSGNTFLIIKKEAQIFSALASTTDTLLEMCNSIMLDKQNCAIT